MVFEQLWFSNLAPIVGLCFLFLLNLRSKTLDMRSRHIFYAILLLEVLELIVANIEMVLSDLTYHTLWRDVCSAIGYLSRPLILMLLILMLAPKKRTRLQNFLLFMPAVVAGIAAFSVFFTGAFYSYTSANVFERGPLGYTPIVCVVIYLAFIIAVVRKGAQPHLRGEALRCPALRVPKRLARPRGGLRPGLGEADDVRRAHRPDPCPPLVSGVAETRASAHAVR